MKQLLSIQLGGRLANCAFELFRLLRFAKLNNISRDCIMVNGSYAAKAGMNAHKWHNDKQVEKNYLFSKMPFFEKCSDIILTKESWLEQTKTTQFELCEDDASAVDAWIAGKSVMLSAKFYKPVSAEERRWLREWLLNENLVDDAIAALTRQGLIPSKTIACHIRRTDFADYDGGKHLQTVQDINKRLNGVNADFAVLVFSDDIEWCKKNCHRANGALFFNISGEDYQDLMSMAVCHGVLKNPGSTFSILADCLREE